MRIEKFTPKLQEAISDSQSLAVGLDHNSLAPIHLILSLLDQVAYVRFASVYKNFREVKDFEDFLGNLEDK